MTGWLESNLSLSVLVGIVLNLLLLAAGYGSLKTRVNRLESDHKNTADALTSHRENTERHLDPVRDPHARDEMLQRVARIEAKLDQLSALVIAHQNSTSKGANP